MSRADVKSPNCGEGAFGDSRLILWFLVSGINRNLSLYTFVFMPKINENEKLYYVYGEDYMS